MQSLDHYITTIARRLAPIINNQQEQYQYAWWILTFVTAKNRAHLIAQSTIELTPHQQEKLEEIITQLVVEHKPLQYIIGSVPFDQVNICVNPPVLIPRPETEEWTAWLIEQLKPIQTTPLSILDLCTGSGCIGIALAKAYPKATVLATDIADHALECTQQNILHNHVHNISVIKSDIFSAIPSHQAFDLIVANPPYIAPEEWSTLDPSVTQWEDKNALVAADHGLHIIKKIIKEAPDHLKKDSPLELHHIPQLVIEIDYKQAQQVKEYMLKAGFSDVHIKKDSEGKDRIVMGLFL